MGADYTVLKAHLAAGEFQKADDETRAQLIQLAGKDAVKRSWVYFTEVQYISTEDLRTIDSLWRAASNDLFGFSVQVRFFKAALSRCIVSLLNW